MTPRLSIRELASRIASGEGSPVEIVRSSLAEIQRIQPALNAFVRVHEERALVQATALAHEIEEFGPRGQLHGLPVAVKDNLEEAGVPCTAGCRAYRDRIPREDAKAVALLRKAGAVVVGRTNMDELADGVVSENAFFGPVRNPWHLDFHPGGSSGGSAVAVATGAVVAALGTDTGGSIRIPASLCGVVGFKPSHGRLCASGIVPLSTTLDQVGPLARSVPDCAQVFAALVPGLGDRCLEASRGAARPVRLGVLERFAAEATAEVGAVFEAALRLLEGMGCRLVPANLPWLSGARRILAAIYRPEAARCHEAMLRERPEDFGDKVRRDLERGLASEPAAYEDALRERAGLVASVSEGWAGFDLLVCPTTPRPARPLGDPEGHAYLRFTCGFNLTGQPALSVPMGLAEDLPVGLQIVGRPGDDAAVFALAAAWERRLGWEPIPRALAPPPGPSASPPGAR
jgi:aspartyl-tRNA(Asn)/glutamyl-tRNA(Gln) amidotransferase subunit A